MDKERETRATWNKIAKIYEDKFMHLDLYDHTYDCFLKGMPTPNARLLDVGCGPGNITKYLLSKNPEFDILGIDLAPNMIARAKKNNPTANFLIMDGRHIGQLTTNFDGIICGFCLPYLSSEACADLLNNAQQLLNRNGRLYLSFVEGSPASSGFKGSHMGRVYMYYHQLEDLKKQLLKLHFEDLKTFKVAYPLSESTHETHTILIGSKRET